MFGNTGSQIVFPILKSYLFNSKVSNQLKASSITATGLIEGKNVEDLLKGLLKNKDTLLVNASKETIAFRKEYLNNCSD